MESSAETTYKELQALCLELKSDGLSAAQFSRLEEMLLGNQELQDAFCRFMLVEDLLSAEFSEHQYAFPSLLADPPLSASVMRESVAGLSDEMCGALVTRKSALDAVEGDSQPASLLARRRRWAFAAVVASVIAMLGIVSSHAIQFWVATATPTASLSIGRGLGEEVPNAASKPGGRAPRGRAEYLVLKSHKAIDLLHRATNTSWQEPLQQPPVALDTKLPEVPSQGAAQLNSFNGHAAGGYVAVLPPGALLELTVFADASGENALALMELDDQGNPTGQLVSFSNRASSSNQASAPVDEDLRLYGQIGSCSEMNSSAVNKYYLLTGMQQIAPPEKKPNWYVADFSVLIEESDLVHLGWDDTGWSTRFPDRLKRDKDYNDITATIRIRRPGLSGLQESSAVRTYPPLSEYSAAEKEFFDDAFKADAMKGYPLTVEPNQGVVLTALSSATQVNSFAVVDRRTGQVWWRCTNHPPGKVEAAASKPHMGAYVIENHGHESLLLSVVSRHQALNSAADGPWYPSRFRVLEDRSRCQTLGFEDSKNDRDWNDVQVNLQWMSDGPSL